MNHLRTAWGYIWRTVWFILGVIGASTVVDDFELLLTKLTSMLP